MTDDYCLFILSHKRPDAVKTVNTIQHHGYTGDWYIVVDHDDSIQEYEENYGEDRIIYLPKDGALPELDRGDNFDIRGTPLYTRFQLWDLADDLGYSHFMMLDDDYEYFQYRFDEDRVYCCHKVENLNRYIENAIEYMERAGLDTLTMAQGGDFIGGSESSMAQKVKTRRKAMNTFLCRTDSKFDFRGVLNDDVNTYIRAQQLGKLFLTTNPISVDQEQTQQDDGGLTDTYLEHGTYTKSFYTILYSPSCTSLSTLHDRADDRIHHSITWRNAVPKIVPESAKNEAD